MVYFIAADSKHKHQMKCKNAHIATNDETDIKLKTKHISQNVPLKCDLRQGVLNEHPIVYLGYTWSIPALCILTIFGEAYFLFASYHHL